MTDRAARRRAAELAKARARRQILARDHRFGWDLANDPRCVGKHAATPHPCSRECCGNQRPYGGPTRQERRTDLHAIGYTTPTGRP